MKHLMNDRKKNIEFFDSNSHPNVHGQWLGKIQNNTFMELNQSIVKNKMMGSLAVGIDNIDNYDIDSFINECNKYENIIPIAGINPTEKDFKDRIKKIKNLGYKGIKIHPRFSQIDLIKDKDLIFENINFCGEHHLTVLFCTYFNDREKGFIIEKPGDYINDLLTSCKKIKIVLMHSGFSLYEEFLSNFINFSNVLFDFSYTVMKMLEDNKRKSLTKLLNKHYGRICVGSDWPEYSHEELLNKLHYLLQDFDEFKIKKITHTNLLEYIEKS